MNGIAEIMMNIISTDTKAITGEESDNMIKIYYKNLANGKVTANINIACAWYDNGANVMVKHYHSLKKKYYTKTIWVH